MSPVNTVASFVIAACALLLTGCATPRAGAPAESTSTAPAGSAPMVVKSRDGKFEGEVHGKPSAGGRFASLQMGMEFREVNKLIGAPSDMHTSETGKRWIPFYFGNDVRRMQTLYKGEGCLTFTGGNVWGGGGNELIAIYHDKSEKCFAE